MKHEKPHSPMTGIETIAAERERQTNAEGHTARKDDLYMAGDLVKAAVCYAMHPLLRDTKIVSVKPFTIWEFLWPWQMEWWKPAKDNTIPERIHELAKAGALIAAEIDRLQRAVP